VLGTAPEARVPLVDEPFRGLEAFEAYKAHLFFGRDRETSVRADPNLTHPAD
jgi:hypothetical protein